MSIYPFELGKERREAPVVSLIGSFNWQPTFSAARRLLENLWPQIKLRRPDARLMIVGRKAKSALEGLVSDPKIELVEDVPDMTPYWRKTDVLLYAPSRGSGMKVKVIEAMALGVPVVTTTEGVEGLDAVDRVHAGIAEDDPGLVERALELLETAGLGDQRRIAALRLGRGRVLAGGGARSTGKGLSGDHRSQEDE